MAAPVLVSTTTAFWNGNSTELTIAKPVGVVSGDYLVKSIAWDESPGTVTFPSPLVEKLSINNGSNNTGKVAGGFAGPAEPANYQTTYTSGQFVCGGLSRITGTDGVVTLGSSNTGNSETATALAMTIGADALSLAFLSVNRGRTLTPPGAPWSTAWALRTTGSGDNSGGLSSGGTGAAAWTWGGGATHWAAQQFTLGPAGAPAGVGYTPHHVGAGVI